jgi:hypothetical protein
VDMDGRAAAILIKPWMGSGPVAPADTRASPVAGIAGVAVALLRAATRLRMSRPRGWLRVPRHRSTLRPAQRRRGSRRS